MRETVLCVCVFSGLCGGDDRRGEREQSQRITDKATGPGLQVT